MTNAPDLRRHYATLIADICLQHGIEPKDLWGRSRTVYKVKARRELAKALRADGLSYPDIGAVLDRHHTAAMCLADDEHRAAKSEAARIRYIEGRT